MATTKMTMKGVLDALALLGPRGERGAKHLTAQHAAAHGHTAWLIREGIFRVAL
jgi:hypothetical protein